MRNLFNEAMIPFWIAVGSTATAVALLIAILSWRRPRTPTPKSEKPPRLTVRRILSPGDDDLQAAYDVYRKEITNRSELDSFDDIQRWLAEAEQSRRTPEPPNLDEYLLIAKSAKRVCGFFYGQYYRSHHMFLVGYLAMDHDSDDAKRETSLAIIKYLVRLLKKDHSNCAGVIFEIALESKRHQQSRTAKERLFAVRARKVGVVFKRLDIKYRQPKLSLWDPSLTEQRQHLVYGRLSGPPLSGHIGKQEASHVLDVVYNYWYGDYYLDEPPKDAEYRKYLRAMYKDVVSRLPAQVGLI